jgi:hypothetical protein
VTHLTPAELIDLAEGERADADTPHLVSCPDCRGRLANVRALLKQAAAVDVPEPSPLFWQHFSARVSNAIAADAVARSSRRRWLLILIPATVTLALIVAAVTSVRAPLFRTLAPEGDAPTGTRASVAAESNRELLNDSTASDDPVLAIVADLISDIGLDGAAEAGMTPDGTAEHAVTHMNTTELGELRRILQKELGVS